MRISFDVVTRLLTLDQAAAKPWGTDLQAHINRHGKRLDIRGLTIGVFVSVNGAQTLHRTWPSEGVKFSRTDQDVLLTQRARWSPDDEVVIKAWLNIAGEEHTGMWNFIAPRPAQPYPSWTWNGTAWVAPVPYPNDGQECVWDEDSQEWIVA